MCRLAGVSRASYYRNWEAVAPDEAEMAARAAIHEVVLRRRRRYGCVYRTPEEFERDAAASPASGESHDAATMKFFSPPIPAKVET